MNEPPRRRFLRRAGATVGVSSLLGVAGCNEGGDSSPAGTDPDTVTPARTPTVAEPTRTDRPTETVEPTDTRTAEPTETPAPDGRSVVRPAAGDGAFYAVSDGGRARALAADVGEYRWEATRTVGTDVAPVVSGDTAAFVDGDTVVGLTTDDGSERWSTTLGGAVEGLASGAGVVVAATERAVTALADDDGSERWRTPVDTAVTTPPGLGDGTVAVGLSDGAVLALHTGSGERRWQSALERVPAFAPTVAHGSVIVATTRRVRSFGAESGDHRWAFDPDFAVTARPVAAGETVALAARADFDSDQTGTMTPAPTDVDRLVVDLVGLAPADGAERWRHTEFWSGNFTDPGPRERRSGVALAATTDRVCLLGPGELLGYEASDGERLWSQTDLSFSGAALAVTDGVVSEGTVGMGVTDGEVLWPLTDRVVTVRATEAR